MFRTAAVVFLATAFVVGGCSPSSPASSDSDVPVPLDQPLAGEDAPLIDASVPDRSATDNGAVDLDVPVAVDGPGQPDVAVDLPMDLVDVVATDTGSAAPTDAACPGDATSCGDRCVNLASDPLHCGTCAANCNTLPGVVGAGVRCEAGRCVIDGACAGGRGDCDNAPMNGCEADLTSASTCGRCENSCAGSTPICAMVAGDGGVTRACTNGCTAMTPVRCGTSCVETSTDLQHCGACGQSCVAPTGGGATCTGGTCSRTCTAGSHLCGSQCVADTSPNTCGSRCAPCPAGPAGSVPSCVAGTCDFACGPDLHRCASACVAVTSVMGCGSSCTPCPTAANADPTCDGTRCGTRCRPGFADCDGNLSNGCEADLSTPTSCGRCGTLCPARPNAAAACRSNLCAITCVSGYADCNGNTDDGCETAGFCTRDIVLLSETFESGSLTPTWDASNDWFWDESAPYQGRLSIFGTYSNDAFSSYCFEHGELYLARDLDLSLALSARLEFAERVVAGSLDQLVIVGSSDSGATWQYISSSAGASEVWRTRSIDLVRYLGQPRVRVGFTFRNRCPDTYGAEWSFDAISVRATVRTP